MGKDLIFNPYVVFYGKKFLLNCLTKKIYRLNETEYIQLKKRKYPKKLKNYLKKELILVEKNLFFKNILLKYKKQKDPYYFESLLIVPANRCNLRCSYCFVYGGKKPKKIKEVDLKDIKRAIELFFEKNTCKEPLVTFYGGEPLLRPDFIFDCINFIEKKLKKKIKKRIITNGTLITKAIASKIKKHNIEIAVSIDGMKEIHDKVRVYPNGKGSFENALRGFLTLKNIGVETNILCTVWKHNILNLEENIKFLCSLKPTAIALNLPREISDRSLKKEITNKEIIEKYAKCLQILYSHHIPELNFLKLIKGFIEKVIPFKPCSACGAQMVISPDNYVGPCQAYINSKKYFTYINKIKSKQDLLKNKYFELWRKIDKISSKKCFGCEIMPLCMDDCIIDRKNYNKDFLLPTSLQCAFRKKMVEILVKRLVNKQPLQFDTK